MRGARIKRMAAYALSRPEAYLIVGLVFVAIVVAIVGGWPGWVIAASVLGGAMLMVLLIADSLADPSAEHGASLADVDLSTIRDGALRAKLGDALAHVRAAQRLSLQDNAAESDVADDELPDLEQAVRSIYQMCQRLQDYRSDALLQQDLLHLQAQQRSEGRLSADRAAQLRSLQQLEELVRQGEQEVDNALARLGSAYADMRRIKAMPEIKGRAVDALHQLGDSTKRLSELAKGYDEVFANRVASH